MDIHKAVIKQWMENNSKLSAQRSFDESVLIIQNRMSFCGS
jgi:hypothetical protein